jgi:hypothetical protein
MTTVKDIYDMINIAIDDAFVREKYQLNFFQYLEGEKFKRKELISFMNSSLYTALLHQIEELNLYLDGSDAANMVRESYGWMGKPRARKIKEYLEEILDDAKRYEQSKKPGRKPKITNK